MRSIVLPLVLALWLGSTPTLAAAEAPWVTRSNANADLLLKLYAKYEP